MTPGARVAAAIDILDRVKEGEAAEKALTNWARGARYAGSGDRAAVRDHVFDVLRQWRSSAWAGGAETGRGRMIGLLRQSGADLDAVFTGQGHAPTVLTEHELRVPDLKKMPRGAELDLPDWLLPDWDQSLGEAAAAVAHALKQRAAVFLRVNAQSCTREEAISALSADGILAKPHETVETALVVTEGERRLRNAAAFKNGSVELQDASSQAVVNWLPKEDRVLDFCAGGGGKALALAARGASVTAHDVNLARMREIPDRARRAGVRITCVDDNRLKVEKPFDLVLCDAPCSGSGAWRRSPDAKWRLSADDLAQLWETQVAILERARAKVRPGGMLVYVTCSVLAAENERSVSAFCERYPEWQLENMVHLRPDNLGDGFFAARLKSC